jgi:hypothetical protein
MQAKHTTGHGFVKKTGPKNNKGIESKILISMNADLASAVVFPDRNALFSLIGASALIL